MSLAFLAPIMLAGAGLLAAPYFIHRIRRPEREPMKFSSLLFVPDVKKEVIERRRLQHILLMLTRMAILLLLAFAFARPFAKAAVVPGTFDAAARHVILIDTSFSMLVGDRFDTALDEAEWILDALTPEDEVAVIAFDDEPTVIAPFTGPEDSLPGSVATARDALRALAPSAGATNYGAALRQAQSLLIDGDAPEDGTMRRVIHVVSDLQRSGMPLAAESWKLMPSLELHAVSVADGTPRNFAVADAFARRTVTDEIRIVAKVKNWSVEDADVVPVTLHIDGKQIESKEKPIRSGNATQFSFSVPTPADDNLIGYLSLPDDDVADDNRRYITWSPPIKHEVVLISDHAFGERDELDPATWPAVWFIERGLPSGGKWPFASQVITGESFARLIESGSAPRPSGAILCNTRGVPSRVFEALADFASGGGGVLVIADDTGEATKQFMNERLMEVDGSAFNTVSPSQYELITRVELEHPIFAGFQGHLYNDFSSLRFHNYINLDDPPAGSGSVLARFESGRPAMVETPYGNGTMIIWPFPVRLSETNLPKSSRFVPILYETMRHVCRVDESKTVWHVGDALTERDMAFDADGVAMVESPGQDAALVSAGERVRLNAPGIVRSYAPESPDRQRVDAVNVRSEESDPSVVDPAEFELRLAATPRVMRETQAEDGGDPEEASVAQEYGILFMVLVVAGIAFESWYMSRMTRTRSAE